MVWKGSEAAGNQCEQSSEEAWEIKENPYTKREERISTHTHIHTYTHTRRRLPNVICACICALSPVEQKETRTIRKVLTLIAIFEGSTQIRLWSCVATELAGEEAASTVCET